MRPEASWQCLRRRGRRRRALAPREAGFGRGRREGATNGKAGTLFCRLSSPACSLSALKPGLEHVCQDPIVLAEEFCEGRVLCRVPSTSWKRLSGYARHCVYAAPSPFSQKPPPLRDRNEVDGHHGSRSSSEKTPSQIIGGFRCQYCSRLLERK